MAKRYANTALSVATERMLDAENRGEYVTAVYWAEVRDRILMKNRGGS